MAMYPIDELGKHGSTLITDDTEATGKWFAITICENTVFATLTGTVILPTGSTLAACVFVAGTTIYGEFTVIDLASGAVIAYIIP